MDAPSPPGARPPEAPPSQIIVLGMHRSGTSGVTRLLNLAGAWFGPPGIATEPNEENPKGFWERRDVREVCDGLLAAGGYDWWKLDGFDLGAIVGPERDRWLDRFSEILTELDDHRPWVVKEPRLCLLLPLLLPLLDAPVVVHVGREPLEVARSLERRNGFAMSAGLALWELHTVAAFEASAGLPQVSMHYAHLMADPIGVTARLVADLTALGVAGLTTPDDEEITDFITPSLHRQRRSAADRPAWMTESQLRLAAALDDGTILDGPPPPMSEAGLGELHALQDHEQLRLDTRELTLERNSFERRLGALQEHHDNLRAELDRETRSFERRIAALERQRDEMERYRDAEVARRRKVGRVADDAMRDIETRLRRLEQSTGGAVFQRTLRLRQQLHPGMYVPPVGPITEARRALRDPRAEIAALVALEPSPGGAPEPDADAPAEDDEGPTGVDPSTATTDAAPTAPEGPTGRRPRRDDPDAPPLAAGTVFDVAVFWKQNDSGIYGRRQDMFVAELAASKRIGTVVHFDRPVTPEFLLEHRRDASGVADQRRLVVRETAARILHRRDEPGIRRLTFVFGGPRSRRLVRRRRSDYPAFVRDEVRAATGGRRPLIVWTYPSNDDLPTLIDALDPEVVVTDIVDDNRSWYDDPESPHLKRIEANYRAVIERSDLVLANCEPVATAMAELGADAHVIPNGCELLPATPVGRRPAALRALDGPILAYVGNLSSRIDIDLLEHVARSHPEWNLVLVGSAHLDRTVLRLDDLPNVHFLGVIPHREARELLRHVDVGLIPHVDDEMTRSMNPLKAFVYASTGTPVVSTPVANLVDIEGLITVADGPEAFVAAIEARLAAGRPDLDVEALVPHSWRTRVGDVFRLLDDVLDDPGAE